MIDIELQRAYDQVMLAVSAEDVFGDISSDQPLVNQLEQLEKTYERLRTVVDPELYKADLESKELAWDVSGQLEKFYQRALERIKGGFYGARRTELQIARGKPSFQTATRQYYLGPVVARGDISTVYKGECVVGDEFAGQVVVKIADDSQDNDLVQNEVRVLKLFQQHPAAQLKHLPVLLDHFRTTDEKLGVVLRQLEGFDFCAIRENSRYKNGVPEKHMVWILSRLLSAVGYAHSLGVVHGNIEPAHLMIRPRDHNAFLIDWSYAAVDPSHTGDGFKIYNEKFSPPEVKEKKPPLPSSDLYSLGMCMIYILGGDVETKTMPEGVNPKLRQFINYFVLESPLQRPQDAWEMYGQLNHLVVALWGPKKFLRFEM